MCGIAGIYSLKEEGFQDSITQMRQALLHRGRDDQGIYVSPDRRFYLTHTRLSIIDLTSSGHQPMSDRQAQVWISYNGQIYNYRQLQAELKNKGYEFISHSDTEVIIQGYKEWGMDGLLRRLRGMFAFALYDFRGQNNGSAKLFLVRDRFGLKPLYYYQDPRLLIFASEVGSIIKSGVIACQRNQEADIAFFLFGHLPEPLSTIKNIFSLPAASYLLWQGVEKKIVSYYDPLESFTKPKIKNSASIYDELFSILRDSVEMHLVSDAPLGIFLSGGIDSSSLVALASKVKDVPLTTLSIVFKEQDYSELPYQRLITQQYRTDHRQFKVTQEDFYDELENIFAAIDQPTVDGVNTYFCSRAARMSGLKVMLSGMGGDELFCGYESFKTIGFLRAWQRAPHWLKAASGPVIAFNEKWRKLSYLENYTDLDLYLTLRGLFAPQDVARILGISEKEVHEVLNNFKLTADEAKLSALNSVDWLSYMEITQYLKNQLFKDTDFMSMYHGVETRVPFLDHLLLDYVASVDARLKFARRRPKSLLVKALGDLLPLEIVRRKKQGFVFPFALWLKKRGRELLQEAVSKENFNQKYADYLWQRFAQGRLHWSRVWALIVRGKQG